MLRAQNSLQHYTTLFSATHIFAQNHYLLLLEAENLAAIKTSQFKLFFRFFPVSLNVYCWICPIDANIYNIFSYSLLYVTYVVHAIVIQNNVIQTSKHQPLLDIIHIIQYIIIDLLFIRVDLHVYWNTNILLEQTFTTGHFLYYSSLFIYNWSIYPSELTFLLKLEHYCNIIISLVHCTVQ